MVGNGRRGLVTARISCHSFTTCVKFRYPFDNARCILYKNYGDIQLLADDRINFGWLQCADRLIFCI